jgi:2-C-methyl-D-erythritol 2,4-cyclodiphosphate synthase
MAVDLRVGIGVDAHAFADGVPLVIGGVRFPSERGLAGHSDGDVLTHALIDALLGAAGMADIGAYYPGTAEWKDAISLDLLTDAYRKIREVGYELVNADCILIGEQPRLAPHRLEMRRLLAEAMGVAPEKLAVRATSTDKLGFAGRGEGLAAQAVALLQRG